MKALEFDLRRFAAVQSRTRMVFVEGPSVDVAFSNLE